MLLIGCGVARACTGAGRLLSRVPGGAAGLAVGKGGAVVGVLWWWGRRNWDRVDQTGNYIVYQFGKEVRGGRARAGECIREWLGVCVGGRGGTWAVRGR